MNPTQSPPPNKNKKPKHLNFTVVCENFSESVLPLKHANPQTNTSNHGGCIRYMHSVVPSEAPL